MLNDSSAVEREETPHTNSTQQNGFRVNRRIGIAYRRRAQAVIRDRSIDAQSRALIRYALEGNDPWLAELVRRVDAGESLVDSVDLSQEPHTSNDDDLEVEKIEALAEMICGGDEPDTKSAALLVLMATLEDSTHPKALANTAKHVAFNHCAERNLCGMVDAEIRVVQAELFAGKAFRS